MLLNNKLAIPTTEEYNFIRESRYLSYKQRAFLHILLSRKSNEIYILDPGYQLPWRYYCLATEYLKRGIAYLDKEEFEQYVELLKNKPIVKTGQK